MKKTIKACTLIAVLCISIILCSCGANTNDEVRDLPLPDSDETTAFGIDKNINQSTIDEWLGRDDVVYRDVRMLVDPANFEELGNNPDLDCTIEGFKIVSCPYLFTLPELPVSGAYDGDRLFEVEWTEDNQIVSVEPLYEESMMILEELFPKDKAIFLMCGGGGYANMTKNLLLNLGWDPDKLYNIGGNWEYEGSHAFKLVESSENNDGKKIYATWRADYAFIDFSLLHKI